MNIGYEERQLVILERGHEYDAFLSCVAGMMLSTYYYYYFISSDFETPIVGAFIEMVYGIFVLVLAGVGTAVFAIRNRKEAVKNGDI